MSLSASCRVIEPAVDNCIWVTKIIPISTIVIESDDWILYQTDVAAAVETLDDPTATKEEKEQAIGNIRLMVGQNRDILTKRTARQIAAHNRSVKLFCTEKN